MPSACRRFIVDTQSDTVRRCKFRIPEDAKTTIVFRHADQRVWRSTQQIPSAENWSFLPDWLEMRSNGLGNTRAWPRPVFASWSNGAAPICRDH
jgi:hypothetical protein